MDLPRVPYRASQPAPPKEQEMSHAAERASCAQSQSSTSGAKQCTRAWRCKWYWRIYIAIIATALGSARGSTWPADATPSIINATTGRLQTSAKHPHQPWAYQRHRCYASGWWTDMRTQCHSGSKRGSLGTVPLRSGGQRLGRGASHHQGHKEIFGQQLYKEGKQSGTRKKPDADSKCDSAICHPPREGSPQHRERQFGEVRWRSRRPESPRSNTTTSWRLQKSRRCKANSTP